MNSIRQVISFFRNWTLPISMITGVVSYFVYVNIPELDGTHKMVNDIVNFVQPALIFLMLLLAFCKVNPRDLRPHRWQLKLLAIQTLSFTLMAIPIILWPELPGRVIIESAMVCMICPTATAASVVTGKLRGNGSYVIPASAVKGPITIAVSRPGVSTPVLTEYLKLRDKESIYCISVSGSAGDGRIYSLDDQVFAFDETHSRHVFLFRSSEKPEKLRERLEELSPGVGNRESIHAAGDANGSGRMDISDAQFIYNTYLLREELKEGFDGVFFCSPCP